MDFIGIPGTDLTVSPICLGTSQMGTAIDLEESCRLLDLYNEHGGNFVDTAHIYGDWVPDIPRSIGERTVGTWLKGRKRRDDIVVATKGGHWRFDAPLQSRVTPDAIAEDVDESLHCLGSDYIDLYCLHRDDTTKPVGVLLEALERERQAGKIRWYGASNWSSPRMMQAEYYAANNNLTGFTASQVYWNSAVLKSRPFADPGMELMTQELYEFHSRTGMAAIPYHSQAGGLYTKMARTGPSLNGPPPAPHFDLEKCRARLNAMTKVSNDTGLTVTQIALAILCSQPFPTIPVVGCRTPEQLRDSLTATSIKLSPAQVHSILDTAWHVL